MCPGEMWSVLRNFGVDCAVNRVSVNVGLGSHAERRHGPRTGARI